MPVLAHLRRSVILIVIATAGTFLYALAGTAVSHVFFSHQADGSVGANGSTLVGQNWSATACPGHPLGSCVFQGRPDDLGPYAGFGDDPLVANGRPGESAGTNLGPRSKVLLANTEELVAYWHARGVSPTPDLVTTSASGYDPDITPLDATVQIPMVAAATGLSRASLVALIRRETNPPQWGFLGQSDINVLQLNLALRALQ